MKLKKKVVILKESQVNSLMDNLRSDRDKTILKKLRIIDLCFLTNRHRHHLQK